MFFICPAWFIFVHDHDHCFSLAFNFVIGLHLSDFVMHLMHSNNTERYLFQSQSNEEKNKKNSIKKNKSDLKMGI